MKDDILKTHGAHVLDFSRSVPNLGRLGQLTEATMAMLRSKDWRDYRDAIGTYHWLPGEYDYFLALQTVDARDIARLYLDPEQRAELAGAMDRTRTGEARYRRTLDEVCTANPAAAQFLTTHWGQYGWDTGRVTPVGDRAVIRAKTGKTKEAQARVNRKTRLRRANGWRSRVARIVAAARGCTRDELYAVIDELKQLARTKPRLTQSSRLHKN